MGCLYAARIIHSEHVSGLRLQLWSRILSRIRSKGHSRNRLAPAEVRILIVSIRGAYLIRETKRLEDYLAHKVETELSAGNRVQVSAKDIFELARSGAFLLPRHVNKEDSLQLFRYCSTVLYQFKPNGGSVKRELWGRHLIYEFFPKED